MGAYLELLEEKKEMGLISTKYFNQQTSWYNNKHEEQSTKNVFDSEAEKKLALLKQDKTVYLTLEMISILKETEENTNQIKGWVTFFGVLYILAIAVYLLLFAIA